MSYRELNIHIPPNFELRKLNAKIGIPLRNLKIDSTTPTPKLLEAVELAMIYKDMTEVFDNPEEGQIIADSLKIELMSRLEREPTFSEAIKTSVLRLSGKNYPSTASKQEQAKFEQVRSHLRLLLNLHQDVQSIMDIDFVSIVGRYKLSECSNTELVMLCETIFSLSRSTQLNGYLYIERRYDVSYSFKRKLFSEIESRALCSDDPFEFVMLTVAERICRSEWGELFMDSEDHVGKKVREILADNERLNSFTEGQILKLKEYETIDHANDKIALSNFIPFLGEKSKFGDLQSLFYFGISKYTPLKVRTNPNTIHHILDKALKENIDLDKVALTIWMSREQYPLAVKDLKRLKKDYGQIAEDSVSWIFFNAIKAEHALQYYDQLPSKWDSEWMRGFLTPGPYKKGNHDSSSYVDLYSWEKY